MLQGVVDSPENLESRYGIPRRLAVRIAALVGFGVQVSAALLEEAARKAGLREFLVSDALFEAAKGGGRLVRDALKTVREVDALDAEGALLLVLSEELLAERILPPAVSPRGLPVHRPGGTPGEHLPLLNELLQGTPAGDEALRREKIRFLTGTRWEDRLEALRRILLVSQAPTDKAGVLFFALRDDDHRVIGEAVKAFREIGLSPAVADSLIELIRGDESAQKQAVGRLLHGAPRAQRSESDVLVAVAARLIRDDAFEPLKAKLLKLLRAHLRGRENSPEDLREIVRILTRHVPPGQEDAQLTLRDLLLWIGKSSGTFLCDALWEEVEAQPWGAHRTFLLTLLGRLENRKNRQDRIEAILLTEEIPRSLERGNDLAPYRHLILRSLKTVFTPILDLAQKQTEERRALIFRVLGEVVAEAELKAGARVHRIKGLLALADRSGRTVRRTLLRARLHSTAGLAKSLRRRFVDLYLSLLESEFLPQHNQEIWSAMRELGWVAADPLVDYVGEDGNDSRQRKEALGVIEEFLADAASHPCTGRDVQDLSRRLDALSSREGFALRNEVTPLLGRALLHPAMPRKEVQRVATLLVRRLGGGYTPGDVGALPFLARSDRVSAELKRKMIRRLLPILDEGGEYALTRENRSEEGLVLEVEAGTSIHTQQLPAALKALEEAALSLSEEEQGSAYMIARTLMRTWDEVVRWKRVWGAEARSNIVRALAALARSPRVSPSLAAEIFLFLVRQFFALPHELHLAEAVTLPMYEGRFPNAGGIAQRLLDRLVAMAQDGESVGPDEAGRYLLAAARIVASVEMPPRETGRGSQSVHLVDLLEQRVQLGFREDGEALRILAASPGLSRHLRERADALSRIHVPKDMLEDQNG